VSRRQRLIFLAIAALIAVVAVVVLVFAGSDGGDDSEVAATATPAATATAGEQATKTPTPKPPAVPVVTGEGIKKLRFKQGDQVRFQVRSSDVTDEVHVHGYDLMKDIKPGQTISFSFPASITGIFEVEFEDAGQQIAQLRVDPD
jgi:hypothetical protein